MLSCRPNSFMVMMVSRLLLPIGGLKKSVMTR